ncbi:MAG: hypothetical protein AAFO82_07515 [Bacteroidota bacterium]
MNGIQLLKALPHLPMVIFTTAYTQYAVESYNLDAIDYLLKPIEFDRFLKAIHKVSQRKKEGEHMIEGQADFRQQKPIFFFVKSGTKSYKVRLSDILYLEASGNYVNYILANQKIMSLNSVGFMYSNEFLSR